MSSRRAVLTRPTVTDKPHECWSVLSESLGGQGPAGQPLNVTCLVIDLLLSVRDPVPKLPKSRSFLNFVKKHSLGSASSSSLAQLGATAASASVHDLPSVLHDHDLLQPALSQGKRIGGTIHGLGALCSVCGRQLVGVRGDQGEVSVRAGSNFRCPEHSPTQR
jgi:hypothetical protein